MKKSFLIIVSLLICATFLFTSCGEATVDTSEKIKDDRVNEVDTSVAVNDADDIYYIIYKNGAGAAVKKAAQELQKYIEQSTGVYISITTDDNISVGSNVKVVSLGETRFFGYERSKMNVSNLGSDGFIIKTVQDGNIMIEANTDRGVLYGAYDLLEKNFGIKFVAFDYTYVPSFDGLVFHKFNVKEIPAIETRCYLARHLMYDKEYTSHMRMNDDYIKLTDEYGGRLEIDDFGGHGHGTSLVLVDPELYADEHPEWYWFDNGKVKDICYSHVGLKDNGDIDESIEISPVKLAIEKVYERVTDHEYDYAKYFFIGQSDTYGSGPCCGCALCTAQSAVYGRSGIQIRYINAISRGVKKKLEENGIEREFNLLCFAYNWSIMPPWNYVEDKPLDPTVVPDDNVYIRLASIGAQNYYTINDDLQNSSIRNAFIYWAKITDRFMIWSYNTVFNSSDGSSGYLVYYPTLQTFGENFKLYQEMGATYVMLQASFNEECVWQDVMETYIASKMLWNPDLDAEVLKQEFISLYYHGVEDYVNQFIDNMDMRYSVFTDSSYPASERPDLTCYTSDLIDVKYYTADFWQTQISILKNAIASVDGLEITATEKEDLKHRLNVMLLSPQFMLATKYSEYYPGDTMGKYKFLKEFFANCSNTGLVMYSESGGVENLKYRLGYKDI